MGKIKEVVQHILFVIAIVLVCFVVYTAAKGESFSVFGYRVLRVISSSMQPTISDETCIIIREVEPDALEVGDIITFISTDPVIYGYYNTHRIYDIYTGDDGVRCFVTKGDANPYPDDYDVTPDRLVGKYIREVPYGTVLGKALNHLRNRNVYFLVVMLPLLLCLLSYIYQLIQTLLDEKKDEEDEL